MTFFFVPFCEFFWGLLHKLVFVTLYELFLGTLHELFLVTVELIFGSVMHCVREVWSPRSQLFMQNLKGIISLFLAPQDVAWTEELTEQMSW